MYNAYKSLGLITLIISSISLLSLFLNSRAVSLTTSLIFRQSVIISSFLALASFLALIALTCYYLHKDYRLTDIKLSLATTYHIRQYCYTVTDSSKTNDLGQSIPTKQYVAQQANRSLHSLSVTFQGKRGHLVWLLPNNHESKDLLLALFPKIQRELDEQTPFTFNNITHVHKRRYEATAKRLGR